MLDTIKSYITMLKQSDVSFESRFLDYIQRVQDAGLDAEINRLCRQNTLNIRIMDTLLSKDLEVMAGYVQ